MPAKPRPTNDRDELLRALDGATDQKGDETDTSVEPEAAEVKDNEADDAAAPRAKKSAAKAKSSSLKTPGKGQGKAKSSDQPPSDETPEAIEKPQSSSRRRVVIISIAAVGFLLVVAAAGWYFTRPTPATNTPATNDNRNAPSQLVPRRIDGVLDEPANQNTFPVAAMIENEVSSRPQSGLDQANIMYEALAEGGITRFLAIFAPVDSLGKIGPIRSARPYYVDWARAYDPLYVHVGGSPKALERIGTTKIRDFNQFYNAKYFFRDPWKKTAVEHTMYTTGKFLDQALIDLREPTTGSYTPWKYKDEVAAEQRPTSQHLTIDFSTFSYKVDYEYDPVTNTYARSQAGQPHLMRDNTPIRPKNIVVLTVGQSLEQPAKDNKGRLAMETIGSGQARFFLDGKEQRGTWKKASPQESVQLLLDDGTEAQLNAGQTWVEIVPPDRSVTVR